MSINTLPPPVEIPLLPLPAGVAERLPTYGKSEIIRWVVGYAQHGSPEEAAQATEVVELANTAGNHGEDIQAAIRVGRQLQDPESVLQPGDSRTLLIYTRVHLYTRGMFDREIELTSMQVSREVEDDPEILGMSLLDSLSLSGGTTQWASALILLQGREDWEIKDLLATIPKEQHTMILRSVRVRNELQQNIRKQKPFELTEADRERTITGEAQHLFTRLSTGLNPLIVPTHSEQVIQAVMNGSITLKEAERNFPMLRQHETDRIAELTKVMNQEVVDTPDHRMFFGAVNTRDEPEFTERSERAGNKTAPKFLESVAVNRALAANSQV
jgi:hypothetical protein